MSKNLTLETDPADRLLYEMHVLKDRGVQGIVAPQIIVSQLERVLTPGAITLENESNTSISIINGNELDEFYIVSYDDIPLIAASAREDGEKISMDYIPVKYGYKNVLKRIVNDGPAFLRRIPTGEAANHAGEYLDKLDINDLLQMYFGRTVKRDQPGLNKNWYFYDNQVIIDEYLRRAIQRKPSLNFDTLSNRLNSLYAPKGNPAPN